MNTQISRLLIGSTIAIFGAALLFDGLNIINTDVVLQNWWPLLIVVGGVAMLISDSKNYIWAMAVVVAGVFIQLRALGYYSDIEVWQIIWPLILIVIGVSVITGRSVMPQSRVESGDDDIMSILGGAEQKNLSEDFKGSRVRSIMGGAKVDLRKAKIKKEATIEVFTLMGGIELVVPRNITIKNQTNAILGGVSDSTDQDSVNNSPVLTIVGDVILGGVEIKN